MKHKFTKKRFGGFTSFRQMYLKFAICCLMSVPMTSFAATTISGKVVDENNLAMPGVVVQLHGTTTGAITDNEGAYVIPDVDETAQLDFSFVGYKTASMPANKDLINVTMEPDALAVDEVVVVGFGQQKKVNLTGSVAVADSEVFEARPVTSATAALQGAVPGLNITQNSGSLNENPSINIRGIGTIGEGSTGSPLILIDGIEGDINTLNQQDIESVSVLKDAASSSIYGSRASFGVILITTKRGKEGKMKVNYNNSFRFSSHVVEPEAANSLDFTLMVNDSYRNFGGDVFFEVGKIDQIKAYQNGELESPTMVDNVNSSQWNASGFTSVDNRDWFDTIYKDVSFGQEHNISITGGTENHQVYISGNYLNQGGFYDWQSDNIERFATNLRATGKIFDFLSYDYNIKFQRKDYSGPQATKLMTMATSAWPTSPLYDPNGNLTENLALLLRDAGTTTERQDRLYQQFRLIAKPVENWNITAEINYRMNTNSDHTDVQTVNIYDVDNQVYQANKRNFSPLNSYVYEKFATTNYFNPNVFTDYTFDINDAHNFKVMAGFQSENQKVGGISAKRDGIIVPYMSTIDVTTGQVGGETTTNDVTGNLTEWSTVGFFGRLNYDFKGRYLLEANLRYDGTSRFREDKRWNWFPSFSAGWNVAREDFWEPISDVVSTLKFRASYGSLGNQNTTNLYPTYQKFPIGISNGNYLIGGERPNTATSPALLNSNMTWERVATTNIGADFAALRNRLSGSFDYFIRNTTDMVGPGPSLPASLGTAVPDANNTDLQTKGWELNLSWRDRLKCGVGYSAGFQISDSRTYIQSYPNEAGDLELLTTTKGGKTGNPEKFYAGQEYGEIWGLTTIGIAKNKAEMDAHIASLAKGGQTELGQGKKLAAGDIMYADINGDGKIGFGERTVENPGDLSIIGNNAPRYMFGINLAANYKGFDVSCFFQGVMKRDYAINSPTFWGTSEGPWKSVVQNAHMDYFRDEDTYSVVTGELGVNYDAYYPRPMNINAAKNGNKSNNYRVQSGYLLDASYIRLKNMQIGYTFPTTMMDKIGIGSLRLFLSGENLWTGCSLPEMYDPETIDGPNNGYGYPLSRVISFGINLTL